MNKGKAIDLSNKIFLYVSKLLLTDLRIAFFRILTFYNFEESIIINTNKEGGLLNE
jgi:hypothetical protein